MNTLLKPNSIIKDKDTIRKSNKKMEDTNAKFSNTAQGNDLL